MSSVSELRQALGATQDVPVKKQAVVDVSNEGSEKPVTKEQPDGLVYTDSSTFLKVGLCHEITFLPKNLTGTMMNI